MDDHFTEQGESMWSLGPSGLALVASALVIGVVGYRMTKVADELADRTGLGEAIAGALLLGATTSLPGIVTTVTGSLEGDAGFALANPVGGVAVQTVWLAIADLTYRRVNLEHAAASLENLVQSLLLVALLAIPVVAYATPDLRLGWIHPATLAIPMCYAYGLSLLRRSRDDPMWRPRRTADTKEDVPQEGSGDSLARLWGSFAVLTVVMGVAGWVVGQAGLGIVAATGLSGGLVGATFTTLVTSLPELVTVVTAVRIGALTLGVGDIIGGNTFDTLLIAVADATYLKGSVYAAAGPSALVLLGGTLLLTAVLAAALVIRDRKGVGFEGVALPVLWVLTIVMVAYAS